MPATPSPPHLSRLAPGAAQGICVSPPEHGRALVRWRPIAMLGSRPERMRRTVWPPDTLHKFHSSSSSSSSSNGADECLPGDRETLQSYFLPPASDALRPERHTQPFH
jgi:hypothetical protein